MVHVTIEDHAEGLEWFNAIRERLLGAPFAQGVTFGRMGTYLHTVRWRGIVATADWRDDSPEDVVRALRRADAERALPRDVAGTTGEELICPAQIAADELEPVWAALAAMVLDNHCPQDALTDEQRAAAERVFQRLGAIIDAGGR